MSPENLLILFLVIGAGTFFIRLSFIQLFGRIEVSQTLSRLLRFVPPAVLPALIVPALLIPSGQLNISLSNGRIVGAMVATLVGLASKNTLLTICSGMAALWISQMLLP